MIQARHIAVRSGSFALSDISFRVEQGEYAVLMGRTGCGKTTLLEIVCGLRRPQAGAIELCGSDATNLPPRQRGIGYVPQDGALFRNMTIREQLAFALHLRRHDLNEIDARTAELAEWLGIAPLLDRFPVGLSGGEIQRVAIGRALSFRPSILCMDEPLAALDDDTRQQMYALLRDVRARTGVTVLHVSHNRIDAEQIADCVLKLENGAVSRHSPKPD